MDENQSKIPEGYEYLDKSVYSNQEHSFNYDVVKKLEHGRKCYAQHAAWNFCGYVWLLEGVWYEEVWQYHGPVIVLSDTVLQRLITRVNDRYGSD